MNQKNEYIIIGVESSLASVTKFYILVQIVSQTASLITLDTPIIDKVSSDYDYNIYDFALQFM